MAKDKTVFFCGECGAESASWKGQCSACKAWNTLKEAPTGGGSKGAKRGGRAGWTGQAGAGVVALDGVSGKSEARRFSSGVSEFDRALGGGMVEGSVILIGGDPGIGKSTLLLQTLAGVQCEQRLYVTGEESVEQVSDRADRLGLPKTNIHVMAETCLEDIVAAVDEALPARGRGLLVADSIQTLYSNSVESAAGTVSQVRECAVRLTRLAKTRGLTVVLIGHVTKEGNLAGPRVLEHLVDTVLYFEGDPQSPHRLVRAIKNRFGAAQELGAFEMTEKGLVSVDNPSAMFLGEDRGKASGSCAFAYQEGSRPMLLEIQALVDDSQATNARRLAIGMDTNRLAMLLAVLHKHGQLATADQDVFVNVVGGLRITDTGIDLPALFAMISSIRGRPLSKDMICFGEVGLTGELRPVQRAGDRLREAARLGFKYAIVPERNMPDKPIKGMEVIGARNLAVALDKLANLESSM
jgi:DNA repair protein RadA/Sms